MTRRRPNSPGPFLAYLLLDRAGVPDPRRYPFDLPAVRGLPDRLPFHPAVTFLVGENGSGKSTLLEAIACGLRLNPEGGSRNFRFATRASHSPLERHLRLARTAATPSDLYFLRAESFYNVATEIERLDEGSGDILGGYGGRSLHEQSHGESFFALFRNRLRPGGLYLMDEPESALSPKRQLEFLAVLHDHVCRGSQFVIATHSPILLSYPRACLYQLDAAGVREVAYADTDHFLVTRGFLANPKRTLDLVLVDPPPAELEAAEAGRKARAARPPRRGPRARVEAAGGAGGHVQLSLYDAVE